jgi:hypothetical protein
MVRSLGLLAALLVSGIGSSGTAPEPAPALAEEAEAIQRVLKDVRETFDELIIVDTRATEPHEAAVAAGLRSARVFVENEEFENLVRVATRGLPRVTVESLETVEARLISCLPECGVSGSDFVTVTFSAPILRGLSAVVVADLQSGYGTEVRRNKVRTVREYRLSKKAPGEWFISEKVTLFRAG